MWEKHEKEHQAKVAELDVQGVKFHEVEGSRPETLRVFDAYCRGEQWAIDHLNDLERQVDYNRKYSGSNIYMIHLSKLNEEFRDTINECYSCSMNTLFTHRMGSYNRLKEFDEWLVKELGYACDDDVNIYVD